VPHLQHVGLLGISALLHIVWWFFLVMLLEQSHLICACIRFCVFSAEGLVFFSEKYQKRQINADKFCVGAQ
jgi:hypothetical protein